MRKLVFAALMLPTLASGAVYKCVGADGSVSFSDTPCAGAKSVEALDIDGTHNDGGSLGLRADILNAAPSVDRRAPPRRERDTVCRDMASTQVRTFVVRNQVVKGMRISDALKAWGTPSRVNGSQYVYRWGSIDASYFYEEDGCVSSVDGRYRGSKFVK